MVGVCIRSSDTFMPKFIEFACTLYACLTRFTVDDDISLNGIATSIVWYLSKEIK